MEMNQSYLKETMRGGHSELTREGENNSQQAGLDLNYATEYSYGIGESMTLMIPNWEGGSSGYNVGEDSELYETLRKNRWPKKDATDVCKHAPMYHGGDEGTSGPVYVGAIICFLFVLGLLIVPGPYKWALLAATICSLALAWGKNMMWLTEFFFNYFPMYNKFRAVESILVVAEITIPLLGILALQHIVSKKIEWDALRKKMWIAGGITGGLCLFFALFAGYIDVSSSSDSHYEGLLEAITADRIALLKADAWRSFVFILLSGGLIYWYAWKTLGEKNESKMMPAVLYIGLAGLVLIDMVPVNKRFFSEENFVNKKIAESAFAMQPYEQEILKDTSLDYRVLKLAPNAFIDARTSYRLKSIGGYSAAKLRRYQDLIDEHIQPEMRNLPIGQANTGQLFIFSTNEGKEIPVLNMLNMRYAIVPRKDGTQLPVFNPYAMGNCWFVEDVKFVDTPNEESEALKTLDLHTQAVADKKFKDVLDVQKPEAAPQMAFHEDKIELISYAPNCLEYRAQTEQNKVAVFSEIYYPHDWHLYLVDDNGNTEEIPLARVNYTLRGAVIPAGTHTLRMVFEPHALKTDKWSMGFLILALVLSAGALTYPLWRRIIKKQN
jgi:hypothetical protein